MSIASTRTLKRVLLAGGATAVVLFAGFYSEHGRQSSHAAPMALPPAVPVLVDTLKPQKVRLWSEFSGRLHAVDSAEIRPQVSGRITQVLFQDGQSVKAGDLLFVIDPRPYKAAVEKAEANLASAKTNEGFAKVEFDRAANMIAGQAIAKSVYDQRADAYHVAVAAVNEAQAELDQAQIDLDHAYVRAPISGRASRAELTVGNLVQTGAGAPLLTSIVSDDAVYADFDVDEQTYIDDIRGGAMNLAAERRIPVELTLANGTDQVFKGTIYSFDNRIDPTTGTIRARARFDNPDHLLLAGMSVNVRLADGAARERMLVPEKAVSFDQSRKFVFVVGQDDKVAYRGVDLGASVEGARVVLAGLKPGDRVIVDGIQHVLPGITVAPEEVSLQQVSQAP